MGRLAVNKLAYFISILFTFFFLVLSIIARYSGRIDPNENITAAYISMACPALFIINVILFIYWTIRWRYWCIVPLIGIFALSDYILSMYKLFSTTKYSSDSKISLVTYNVHSFGNEVTGYSTNEFVKVLKKNDVDIICFQEYAGNGDFTDKDIYNAFSQIYKYSFIPTSETSLALYSKYPILDSQIIKFENSNNGAIWADLNVKGIKIRVINVHMQTTSFDRMRSKMSKAKEEQNNDEEKNILVQYYTNSLEKNIKKRAKQAKQIAEIVKSTESPVILCGDFNDTPQTYTYNTLKGFLSDGFISAGKGLTSTYKGLYNMMRIDYIFYSKSLSPIKYETIPFDMSDHNPVLMEVGL